MAEHKTLCAKCKKKPAISDTPAFCAECFLAFVGLLGAVTQARLEREAADNEPKVTP